MKLTEDDYAAFERSGIPRQLADLAGLYRVTNLEGSDLVGKRGSQDMSGIAFPYHDPADGRCGLTRLRLDHPPIDITKRKPTGKYLSAFGARNRLYFPPCAADLLADATLPLVIVEGEKKCLSLWHAALVTGNGTGRPAFLPAGLPGAWAFKTRVGIHTNAHGVRVSEKGVLPDFDKLALQGRKVTVLFDADVLTNTLVAAARRTLAAELTHRGAIVWIADTPPLSGVSGIDDLLGLYGLERALEVLASAVRYEWTKELKRSDNGKILPLLVNAMIALRSAPDWAGVLAFNEHSLGITTLRDAPWGPVEAWADRHTYKLMEWFQRHGMVITERDTNAALEDVARDRSFHPVRDYLDSLVWDKVPRLDDWLTLYMGADPSPLTRAIAARWPISAVARIYEPGCQADHVLILESPQGEGKSTAIRILGTPFYSDDIAELGTKDASLGTAGVWIQELPELDAMSRAEAGKIKAFVSRSVDRFRLPYGRRPVEVSRQCVFAGTVNHSQYLKDETGGRRFWPVQCGKINLEALRRDKDQLWAEAMHRYHEKEPWWLDTPELIQAAIAEQEDRYQADPWESLIEDWLIKWKADTDSQKPAVTTSLILGDALFRAKDQRTRSDEIRVGTILRRLGWELGKRSWKGSRQRIYVPSAQSHPM